MCECGEGQTDRQPWPIYISPRLCLKRDIIMPQVLTAFDLHREQSADLSPWSGGPPTRQCGRNTAEVAGRRSPERRPWSVPGCVGRSVPATRQRLPGCGPPAPRSVRSTAPRRPARHRQRHGHGEVQHSRQNISRQATWECIS